MREGGNLHFVTQTTSGTHDVFSDVRVIAAEGAEGIHSHGTKVKTGGWMVRLIRLRIIKVYVRVGIGSHIPEALDYVEEKGWDVDFYMTCFYNLYK